MLPTALCTKPLAASHQPQGAHVIYVDNPESTYKVWQTYLITRRPGEKLPLTLQHGFTRQCTVALGGVALLFTSTVLKNSHSLPDA